MTESNLEVKEVRLGGPQKSIPRNEDGSGRVDSGGGGPTREIS